MMPHPTEQARCICALSTSAGSCAEMVQCHCAGHRHTVRIVNGSLRRWVPLAVLALFAAAEFAAQYLFIATPFSQAVGIPDSALRFIEVCAALCMQIHFPAMIKAEALQFLQRSGVPPGHTCVP